MAKIDKIYKDLANAVLNTGHAKQDRTNTGTISGFGYSMKYDMNDGFPLLTTKRLHWKSIVGELLWFLSGDTNIKYLNDNGISIWNEWSDDNGELGPVYGNQWVNYNGINQIQNVIDQLSSNPDSRRMIVSAWNPSDLDKMALPPCHYSWQVYTRELEYEEMINLLPHNYQHKSYLQSEWINILSHYNIPTRAISLIWNQRSADLFLGVPYNIASYALLLNLLALEFNMVPEFLIGNFGDLHIYNNHIEYINEQITRNVDKYSAPKLDINKKSSIFRYEIADIGLKNYEAFPNWKNVPIAV